MPDYGVQPAGEGTGLLPWSWAVERLTKSHDYWVATVRPDGRPSVSPVWGGWRDDALWFSCAHASRKSRNLANDPRCTITTDNAFEPVIVEGVAAMVTDHEEIAAFTAAGNAKYEVDYSVEFFAANALYRVAPTVVFGLLEGDFTGSPTRWSFS
jgi:pyridoxamine 5'-phosphate oxidase-like protein